MLTAYLDSAMRHAVYEPLEESEGWFASIPGFPGLWASEKTVEETRADLRSALEDWILLGLRSGEQLPVIDEIDLNVPRVA